MQQLARFVKQRAVSIFFVLTIALSFAATRLPVASEVVPVVLVFIPALVALALTALSDGWSGVRALLARPGTWRVRPGWIAIAVAVGLLLRVGMSLLALLLGWIPAIQLRQWSPLQFAFLAAILFLFAIPEELGWRAFALQKLLVRHSALVAGLISGVLWGCVHLALHMPGLMHAGLPLVPVVLEVTSLALIGTWLYLGSGGNLLVASLFHAAQSFFVVVNEGIPQAQQLWLMAGVYGVVALIVALAVPRFGRRPLPGPDHGRPMDDPSTAHTFALPGLDRE